MVGFKKFFRIREFPLLLINITIILILVIKFKSFATVNNFFNIMYSLSINSLIVCGLTVLIVSGVFDISMGVTLGISGMIAGVLMVNFNFPVLVAVLLAILTGALIGLVMGYLVSYLNMNPFIVTIAIFFIVGTARILVSGGQPVSNFPSNFVLIASYKIFNFPAMIIFSILVVIIFDILLRKNIFFRFSYAIGSNENAAYLFGIRVKMTKMLFYVLVSTMSAIGGILLASRLTAAFMEAGANTPFEVIAAIVIGGATLKGGRGTVAGSFLGLILMVLITQSLLFFRVNMVYEKVLIGAVLVIVLIIDSVASRERKLPISKNITNA